jgi:tripartite-type tricarboxylate transporter receptor subunit TctC
MRIRILCLAAAMLVASPAFAQGWPSRPVRVVAAYPAGGSIDIVARLVSQRLGESLGQPFIVENKAGAAGNIGTDFVAKAAPDGYTLLMGSAAAISSAPNVYAKLPYDPLKDLLPIVLVANQPNALIVRPGLAANNVREFIALARANPGKLNYGSSGVGASQHMTAELFAMMTGVQITHVPYKGGAPAMADLMSGQIDFMFDPVPTSIQVVRSGKVRALAVTSLRRSEVMPDLPSMAEAGLDGFELRGWIGLLAPANTPRDLVQRLNGEVLKMLAADLRGKLLELGLDVAGGTPEQFAAFIREDIAKYGRIVKTSGMPQQ